MLSEQSYENYSGVILPYWKKLIDEKNGGFYGFVDSELNVDKKAEKGVILNSRILWFFSNSFLSYGDEDSLIYARHAYNFLKEKCLDRECGGVYWMLNADGSPKDSTKQTYNIAFAIYALSSYFDATGEEEALATAFELFELVEDVATDSIGYIDAFNRNFQPIINEKLSENGVIADRTMNTLLHVLEAYTELYRVSGDEQVENRLRGIIDSFINKIFNRDKARLDVFFDLKMNSIIELESYGHEIEASWLLDRACELLGDNKLLAEMRKVSAVLAESVYARGYKNHSLIYECDRGVQNTKRIWWVQAEAVVGFLNAYKYTSDSKYLLAAEDIFSYISENFVDKRPGSEWFMELDEKGMAVPDKPITEPWKCPYHNGRMCFEIKRRGF